MGRLGCEKRNQRNGGSRMMTAFVVMCIVAMIFMFIAIEAMTKEDDND